jgi:hypothetical protein|tara:strand:- start:30 stop:245 length:216 start_codon:yes stop_codon:yes gene_type:complete
MSDLDDVLQRDLEGKVTWLVSKVSEIDNRVEVIETNHLTHIEKELKSLTKTVSIIMAIGMTLMTGINFVGL